MLPPDQTVFFDLGTISYGFRLAGQITFAVEGHELLEPDIDLCIRLFCSKTN